MANPAVPSTYLVEWWFGDGATSPASAPESSPSPSTSSPVPSVTTDDRSYFEAVFGEKPSDVLDPAADAVNKTGRAFALGAGGATLGTGLAVAGIGLVLIAGVAGYFSPKRRR